MERLFPEIIQVPELSLEEEIGRWKHHAVLARSLARWLPTEVLVREFRRAGVTGEIEAVALAHRHYLFRFDDAQASEMISGRPWVINGQPIAVSPWQSEFIPSERSLLQALLWVRLPSLPIEFWTESIISSILSVAGEFQFLDASTLNRNRGGFARACVRVDLSKPLRPGARIRGSGTPFWQSFVYEHLDGICSECGSLHVSEDCGLKPDASSPASGPRFGPWMAAVRRRKSSPMQQPESFKSSVPGMASPPSPGVKDGWQLPKKVARRQGVGDLPLLESLWVSPLRFWCLLRGKAGLRAGLVPVCQ